MNKNQKMLTIQQQAIKKIQSKKKRSMNQLTAKKKDSLKSQDKMLKNKIQDWKKRNQILKHKKSRIEV